MEVLCPGVVARDRRDGLHDEAGPRPERAEVVGEPHAGVFLRIHGDAGGSAVVGHGDRADRQGPLVHGVHAVVGAVGRRADPRDRARGPQEAAIPPREARGGGIRAGAGGVGAAGIPENQACARGPRPVMNRRKSTTTAPVPSSSARGRLRPGSRTSPPMNDRSAQPSYAHIAATSAEGYAGCAEAISAFSFVARLPS